MISSRCYHPPPTLLPPEPAPEPSPTTAKAPQLTCCVFFIRIIVIILFNLFLILLLILTYSQLRMLEKMLQMLFSPWPTRVCQTHLTTKSQQVILFLQQREFWSFWIELILTTCQECSTYLICRRLVLSFLETRIWRKYLLPHPSQIIFYSCWYYRINGSSHCELHCYEDLTFARPIFLSDNPRLDVLSAASANS